MRVCPSAFRLASGWIAVAVFGWSVAAQAQEIPLTVTYGPAAGTAEGDPDYREVLFLSVPEGSQERIYLRLFDPDTGADHDLVYGAEGDTAIRYTLFGGEGAYTALSGTAAGREQIVGAMGSKDRMDYNVLGDAVNLAARLCSRAVAGQTLVSGSTHAALAGSAEFVARPLPPLAVKGKREPVPVYDIGPATALAPAPLRAGAG